MKRILVLGATGLIGHQIYLRFKEKKDFQVYGLARTRDLDGTIILQDARDDVKLEEIICRLNPHVIVNCLGILIGEANKNPEHAIFLNAFLPHRLKTIADTLNAKLIHISTDCVFSGNKGGYREDDIKDANDIYGRTKALGEIVGGKHLTLRTSVVGPELKEGDELFHWFMRQEGAIKGYTKAIWSGVTTLELAKAVDWAIENDICGLYQVTNGDKIDKFSLLMLFKKYTNKHIDIEPVQGRVTDKSFVDTRKELNYVLPTYGEMVCDMIGHIRKKPVLYDRYQIDES